MFFNKISEFDDGIYFLWPVSLMCRMEGVCNVYICTVFVSFRIDFFTSFSTEVCVIFVWLIHTKGLFTPSESGSESENDQRKNDKRQRIFLFSLAVNRP